MRQAVFLVSVIARTKDLFFCQDRCNSAGAIACGAQGKNPADNGSGFLIDDQLFGFRVFGIAAWSAGSEAFSAFGLGFLNCQDLSAGVSHEPLFKQILERHEVVALHIFRVRIVVDGNVAHTVLWEGEVGVKPGQGRTTAHPRQVFADRHSHPSRLNFGQHGLKSGPVIGHAAHTIIHE